MANYHLYRIKKFPPPVCLWQRISSGFSHVSRWYLAIFKEMQISSISQQRNLLCCFFFFLFFLLHIHPLHKVVNLKLSTAIISSSRKKWRSGREKALNKIFIRNSPFFFCLLFDVHVLCYFMVLDTFFQVP